MCEWIDLHLFKPVVLAVSVARIWRSCGEMVLSAVAVVKVWRRCYEMVLSSVVVVSISFVHKKSGQETNKR